MSERIENEAAIDVETDPIYRAAAHWLTRVQDPGLSLEDSLEWQQWIGADPRHRQAFARLEQVWDQPWAVLQTPYTTPAAAPARWKRWRPAAIAASLAAVLVGALIVFAMQSPDVSYGTRVGENRTVLLDDGSTVVLGGASELVTSFGAHERRIVLKRGEAFFKVAKEPARPFRVAAGDAVVTAIGTEFNVRRGSERVIVAVLEGRVKVSQPEGFLRVAARRLTPGAEPRIAEEQSLEAGDETVVQADSIQPKRQLGPASSATAWQSGQLAFRQEPLKYVLEDVNRYATTPIVLGDDSIGDIRITGTVIGTSVEGWVQGLEEGFGLQALNEDGKIVLRLNPPGPRGR